MDDLILAGALTWLLVFVWWGTDVVFQAGRRRQVAGGLLIVLALVPSLVVLVLGT
jgi:hypothetical protein